MMVQKRPDTVGEVVHYATSAAKREMRVGASGRSANHAPRRSITRVMGFSWDKCTDGLWRQGIDLIGDDRGGQVGESIEDGAVLGQSEGGEFLDVTDNGFDDVAPIEQSLVEERHR